MQALPHYEHHHCPGQLHLSAIARNCPFLLERLALMKQHGLSSTSLSYQGFYIDQCDPAGYTTSFPCLVHPSFGEPWQTLCSTTNYVVLNSVANLVSNPKMNGIPSGQTCHPPSLYL